MNMMATAMLLTLMASPMKIAVVQSAVSDATQTKTMAGELALLPGIDLVDGWKAPIKALTPADMREIRSVMKKQSLNAVVLMLSSGYVLLGHDFLAGPWTVTSPLPRAFLLALKNLEKRPLPAKRSTAVPQSVSQSASRNGAPARSGSERSTPSPPSPPPGDSSVKTGAGKSQDGSSWKLAVFVGGVGAAIISAILAYQYFSYDDDVDVRVYH